MARAGTRKRGTGGLVTAPPIPTTKALRNLELAYARLLARYDALEAKYNKLKDKKK
jgi:hypothetical protein